MSAVVTAMSVMTAVGRTPATSMAAVRAGVSRVAEFDDYCDDQGEFILAAPIAGYYDLPIYHRDHRYEDRILGFVTPAFEGLLADRPLHASRVHLLLGFAPEARPGPSYAAAVTAQLLAQLRPQQAEVKVHRFDHGNAAGLHALRAAQEILAVDPDAVCIAGGVDSLLADETLDWLEKDGRLKSPSPGRHQSLSPGEAAGFVVLEHHQRARSLGRAPLVAVLGVGVAREPHPLLSEHPSRARGLTTALHDALRVSGIAPGSVRHCIHDQNGEFHRAKEWSLAAARVFPAARAPSSIAVPAESLGDVGAAWGIVQLCLGVAALRQGWWEGALMLSTSDDFGECGGAVVAPLRA